jgi:hypothetical protein
MFGAWQVVCAQPLTWVGFIWVIGPTHVRRLYISCAQLVMQESNPELREPWMIKSIWSLNERNEWKSVRKNIHTPKRNGSYTHFSQQPHNKLMWLVIFYYYFFFSFLFVKKNKILQVTSACCKTVVRNECRDHFSTLKCVTPFTRRLIRDGLLDDCHVADL